MKKGYPGRISEDELQHRYEESPDGKAKIEALERALELIASQRKNIFKVPVDEEYFSFIFTGDWHIGSLCERLDVIAACYDVAKQRNIKHIIHSGDIFDGWRMYKGHEFELHQHGWEKQKEWGLRHIPRVNGVTTHFITGNHDESMNKLVGMDVGLAWSEKRPDWNFLGNSYGTIGFETPNGQFTVTTIHPDGGTSYAISYRAQKIVEQLEGGTKPNILGIGHFHKAEFLPAYRNVAVFQTGTAQLQTPFMMRKAAAAHIGFWEISVAMQKGATKFREEFHAFY
jgi:hypothetical protein